MLLSVCVCGVCVCGGGGVRGEGCWSEVLVALLFLVVVVVMVVCVNGVRAAERGICVRLCANREWYPPRVAPWLLSLAPPRSDLHGDRVHTG